MGVLLETVDANGVATLTLNRPERHNAFDEVMVRELGDAYAALDFRGDVRVVVLVSTGRSFCARGDVGWMQRAAAFSEAENLADAGKLSNLLRKIDRMSKPTLALVQGPADGGGVGLAACCDIAIATERATFRLSEVRLGLTLATILPYVVGAIGARQARQSFQTAEPFFTAEARRLGLVHEVTGPDGLAEARGRIVAELLTGGPAAQAASKALVRLAQGGPIDEAMIAETSRRIAVRRTTLEAREGLAAFLEKRLPAWQDAPS